MKKGFFLMLTLLSLWSCSDDDAELVLVDATGVAGGVVVVMDQVYWDSKIGGLVEDFFAQSHPAYYPIEPLFNLTKANMSNFGQYATRRNLVLCKISTKTAKGKPEEKWSKNAWSSGQVILEIKAHDAEDFYRYLQKNGNKWIADFNEVEEKRYLGKVNQRNSKGEALLKQKFGIQMVVPEDYETKENEPNYARFEYHKMRTSGGKALGKLHDIIRGVIVYKIPYTSENIFQLESLLQVRDSVVKQYIQGVDERTHMITVRDPRFPETVKVTDFNSYCFQIRGLWGFTGKRIMGGNFVSNAIIDPDKKHILVLEAYIFAPEFDKREYLREAESLLYTMKFTDPK